MIEALAEFLPKRPSDFNEKIPGYLRLAASGEEGKNFDYIFARVNSCLDDA